MFTTTTDLRLKIAQQLDLEAESRALGAERYRSQRPLPWRTEASVGKDEGDLPPGRQLLKLTIEPMAAAVTEFIDRIAAGGAGRRPAAYKLLSLVSPQEAAYLTGRVVMQSAATLNSLPATAFTLADVLLDHAEMLALKAANKKGYKGLVKKQEKAGYSGKKRAAIRDIMDKEGAKISLTKAEKLATGLKAIELFCAATDLFVVELQPAARGEAYVIRPTEACSGWLEKQHARCEILEPMHLPMVVRPRRWRTPFWGGYLTKRPGQRLVKQWNANYHEELRHVDMEPVYRAVNAVQDVAWRINTPILDVLAQVWDGGGSLGGLPHRDDRPIPGRPMDYETNEEAAKGWRASAAAVHQRNAQALSKRLAISQRLWIATKFKDEEAIYFPHELDFRGRIYPIPVGGPHPQGEDSAKALLQFSEGVALGEQGSRWLAIHIANLFGIDKVSFDERVAWVWKHSEMLWDSATNPLDGHRFWTTADSPYCALAACMEWVGYLTEGEAYVSRIPVALDGSNSGLQHFSAMLRDPTGAEAVNLLPTDKPQDIYLRVAAKAQLLIDADTSPAPEGNGEDAEKDAEKAALWLAARDAWKGGKVTRKIAKRPCMTFCYSATRFGMQGMVLSTLREIDAENEAAGLPPHLGGADNYQAAMIMSHTLWQAVGDVVSAAQGAMQWLRSAATVASASDLPIWWTTPLGLPVLQAYRTSEAERVEVHYNGRRMRVTMATDGQGLDRRAQANGIAPNFVHSLDAAHLMSVVNAMASKGLGTVAVIHDSFGTHAAHTEALSVTLRETFIEQYTPDVLARFRDELAAQLPEEAAALLPELPEPGTLDLSTLHESTYMFA